MSCAYWSDELVRTLTDDGKLATLFVLTSPHMTSVGAMRGTLAGLAAELGWPPRRLERALAPAITAGMIEINGAACYIAMPKFLRHNPPESPNVCKAWVTAIAGLPECQERDALVKRCREYLCNAQAFLKAFDEAYAKAFGEAFPEASAHPSGNQEPDTGTGSGAGGIPLPPSSPGGHASNGYGLSRRRVDAAWGRS